MSIKTMSIDGLLSLRTKIDTIMSAKVHDERRSLQTKLGKLSRVDSPARAPKAAYGRGGRGKVAPKYRNPENPAETWAGRGLKPRWLAAALKSGSELDDFAIGSSGKETLAKAVKKRGRPAGSKRK